LSILLRAKISEAEVKAIRIAAINDGKPVQDFVAELLRAGMAARKDGRGRK